MKASDSGITAVEALLRVLRFHRIFGLDTCLSQATIFRCSRGLDLTGSVTERERVALAKNIRQDLNFCRIILRVRIATGRVEA